MCTAELVRHNGAPAICIDGKIYPPMMMTVRTNNKSNLILDGEYFKQLGKSGIKIFFLICDTEWLKPGAVELFRREADELLKNVPDAYIMVRIGLHPPVSWCIDNPDETMCYSDGIKKPIHLFSESYEADYPAMYSLCSEKWRTDAGNALTDIYKKIMQLPCSSRIAGFFFAAGGTSEWYYMTPTEYTAKSNRFDSGGFEQTSDMEYDNVYGDLSKAFKTNFSKYLKEKYKTNANLRQAWKDLNTDIDNPDIPDCTARYYANGVDYDIEHPKQLFANSPEPPVPANGTNIGHFLDISSHMKVFDFYRAWHIGVADSVIYFGNLIKKLNPSMLTGAFYGSAGATKVFSFGQIGGVERILDSGQIDFLASPGVYENRQPGGFTGQRQVFDSFNLRGRMFIVEDDARTHLENKYFAKYVEMFSMQDTYNVLKREFGKNICENLQAWWFDQLLGGKRYKHPDIYKLFKRQSEIAADAYSCSRDKNSEIAFIYSEESYHVVSEETTHQMVELFRNYEIDLIGAPSDRYYVSDLANPDMPDYKLYVFANTFYLNDSDRRTIKSKLKKNNAAALFMYASGVINPDRTEMFSEKNMTDLIGIDIKRSDGIFSGMFKFYSADKGFIASGLDKGEIYGDFKRKMWANCSSYMGRIKTSRVNLCPCFYAEDSSAENSAYFLDSGKAALSIKALDGFTSVYCGSKYLSADVVRRIAEFAGCHIYCRTNDVLYANKNYITFHAASSGRKTIYLPHESSVTECYSRKSLGKKVKEFSFDILKGETLMFKYI